MLHPPQHRCAGRRTRVREAGKGIDTGPAPSEDSRSTVGADHTECCRRSAGRRGGRPRAATPAPAAAAPGEFVGGLPIGGGFRVPCIIVSPWTAGGWVARLHRANRSAFCRTKSPTPAAGRPVTCSTPSAWRS
ncbi:alkaline phosphatase family protein [Kitasatospora sp. NPDC086801]|uniref:alkaline phosphatase family protein n=1 Tax=Kitasatospora sp. NPDC086801 TaxID=3364066 RepID=UPI0038031871